MRGLYVILEGFFYIFNILLENCVIFMRMFFVIHENVNNKIC